MRFRSLPIVAVLFIAAAMLVQFGILSSIEKNHVKEVVEYKMQLAQKDFYNELVGFHYAADEMRRYVLDHRDNEQEILKETRKMLERYPDIDNMFVKLAPGVYHGQVNNFFPRSYRYDGQTITTAQGA